MTDNLQKFKRKVLVVAPSFPLINQPWMDTYLEQLLINRMEFVVFSLNRSPNNYQSKVDDLNLLNFTYIYRLDRLGLLLTIIKKIKILSSVKTFFSFRQKKLLRSFSGLKLLLNILYFYAIRKTYLDVDVIHSHSEVLSHRFIILAEILNVPLVVTFHGLPPKDVPQLTAEKREELYRYAKRVIVNTDFAKKQVVTLGCPPDKIEVLPQGLPLEDFPFNPHPAPSKGEALQILSVGRFHRDKGQHYSLLALKRLLNDGVQAHWSFVGSGPDLGKLKALVQKLDLENHVTFYEKASSEKLLKLYSQSHIFVLASIDSPGGHVETQGVVLQEAQASGCLVVATRTGGIPECLNHKCDSILVNQQSSRAIFSAIKYYYLNPQQWIGYRARALENVNCNFSAGVIGKKMTKLLIQNS